MKKLILIGGGNLANKENKAIHQYMINCCKSAKPRVLYVNISEKSSIHFIECMKEFNCDVEVYEKLEDIDNADIVFISGGNTESFVKKERLVKKLCSVLNEKIVVGISAGAIFWFEKYYSDSYAYDSGNGMYNYQLLDGIGYFKGFCCPHYNSDGKETFNDHVNDSFALALEDNTAIVLDDEKIEFIKDRKGAAIYYFCQGKLNVLNEKNKEELFLLLKEGKKKIS